MRVMFARVAGIDVHKDMIKVGIRGPGPPGVDADLGGAGVPDLYGCCRRWPVTCASGASPMW
jgi:hypothetical protein